MLSKEELIKRFEERVMPVPYSGCWIWMLSLRHFGYGQFGVASDKSVLAHRFSYEVYKGEIPKGMLVCHACDTPSCVNPDHLFLGTHKDNTQDMLRKGRFNPPTGERQHVSKLKWEDVPSIKEMYANGISQSKIAKQYGLHQSTVSVLLNNKTWKNKTN